MRPVAPKELAAAEGATAQGAAAVDGATAEATQGHLGGRPPGLAGLAGWEGYLNSRGCPGFVCGYLLSVTKHLSFPLTMVHALELLAGLLPAAPSSQSSHTAPPNEEGGGRFPGEELVVHVIGASEYVELLPWTKFEEVTLLFPASLSPSLSSSLSTD